MKLKITSLLLCLAMVLSLCTFLSFGSFAAEEVATAPNAPTQVWEGDVADSYAGGDGTENSPYQIANGAQLARMAAQVSQGSDCDAYYELTADIALNDVAEYSTWSISTAPVNSWETTIGSVTHAFTGNFNGNGHTVFGLYVAKDYIIDSSDATASYAHGLFGYVKGDASISNLDMAYGYVYFNVSYSKLILLMCHFLFSFNFLLKFAKTIAKNAKKAYNNFIYYIIIQKGKFLKSIFSFFSNFSFF